MLSVVKILFKAILKSIVKLEIVMLGFFFIKKSKFIRKLWEICRF